MIRVRVGEVEIRTDDELTVKQVRALLREAAGIALALAGQAPEAGPPIGFSAIVERLPEQLAEDDLSQYFDD